MFDINILAGNIKAYRHKMGIKQFELADKLSVSPQAVSNWEQSLSIPDIGNLCALAELFDITLDTLVLRKQHRRSLMIAVDGGGSKTEFVLFTDEGHIKNRIVLGGSNPNVVGIEKSQYVLKTGIDMLCAVGTDIIGIYCGIAGAFAGDNQKRLGSFLRETYPDLTVACSSDILNVAASVTDAERCITVICGTGSNVTAMNGKEIKRVGGGGYLFDGKGSGFDIGRDVISAVLAAEDGIGAETFLTELVTERLGGSVWESLNAIYAQEKSYVASFAQEGFEAYRKGDPVAVGIIESNLNTLADRINFAARSCDCGNQVIISGGLTHKKDILSDILAKRLDKGLQIVFPTLPQIYGASRLCCRHCNVGHKDFAENFTKDYTCYAENK